ncbi:MAG: tetratricopeptide repeat protein, partial [Sphaerospermopsis sp. SIO1G2]|nr:tetratricopeptide repeat protein [Sphaerospermopsis sp. SIO1G2]
MDWITLLRSLQSDFLCRLKSGFPLYCKSEGQHSELTVISGQRLKVLRDFCWLMAEKYKRTSSVRDVFIGNLKGKLGEEVVKERLADFITEIDYEKRLGGDGGSDFTLTLNPEVGVEVKSRHGTIDTVRWSVSAKEVEKNAVVVCVLIQEEVNEAQTEYNLLLAGFLPTQMIKLKRGKISFGIEQLLYAGGLLPYLQDFQRSVNCDHDVAKFNQVNHVQKSNSAFAPSLNKQRKIRTEINLQSDDALGYKNRGYSRCEMGEYEGGIADYNQAIQINPHFTDAYYFRGHAYFDLGKYAAAIDDFSQVIKMNYSYSDAYYHRGH